MKDACKFALFVLCAGCAPARPAAPLAEPAATAGGAVLLEEEASSSAQGGTPEEALAEDPHLLAQEREKMLAEQAREQQRFTPELRAQAKALVERDYASGRAALQAMLESPHRKASNRARDRERHALQTMELLEFEPDLTVLIYEPGDDWYTELLAPALAKHGKLLAISPDPNGAPEEPNTFYGQRFEAFLRTSSELYGKVEVVAVDPARPVVPKETKVDRVYLFNAMHAMANDGTLALWLKTCHRILGRRGVLGIEQHRAPAGADPRTSARSGYLPEAWVISRVEAAGFKLTDKSEVNANPRDTKDYPAGVWTLPPSYRLGDQEREKYAAIGESDRMTLKFVRLEEPTPQSPFVP